MNTFKFFLWLIKDFLIMGISVGTFCIGGLYTLYVFANDNTYFPLMTIYSFMSIICTGYIMICGMTVPKSVYNMTEGLSPEKYMISLLPISPLKKYMSLVIATLTLYLSALLMSLPLEIIGSMLTATYSPDTPIEIGGMLNHFAHDGIFTLLLAGASASLFCSVLFRRISHASTAIMAVSIPAGGYLGCTLGHNMAYTQGKGQYDLPESLLMTENAICIFATIAFIISGYYIFKRWQVANNGILNV